MEGVKNHLKSFFPNTVWWPEPLSQIQEMTNDVAWGIHHAVGKF